eukprot:361877_1
MTETKDKEKQEYPILKSHNSIKPSLYNALDWTTTIGHSVTALGSFMFYHGAFQQGKPFWDKYKLQRRLCLLGGFTCGIITALLRTYKWKKQLKVLDYADRYPFAIWPFRITHTVAVPLFMIYVEFFGGVETAKYGVMLLMFQYMNAKFMDKFGMDYMKSYFQQAKDETIALRKKMT